MKRNRTFVVSVGEVGGDTPATCVIFDVDADQFNGMTPGDIIDQYLFPAVAGAWDRFTTRKPVES